MTNDEVQAIIKGHLERNKELLRTLRSKNIDINKSRPIEHHFWSNSREDAALLARELYRRNFLILALDSVTTDDGSNLWNVEGQLQQPPSQAASPQLAKDLTELAARFESTYDGWGTSV